MKNKGILWVFVILLALTTLYCLSFGPIANNFERQAHDYAVAAVNDSLKQPDWTQEQVDSAVLSLEKRYLRDSSEAEIYPVFGHSYRHVKQNELNLGLDLQGGMSVTLEVSIPDLLIALSDYNSNADFRGAIADAQEAQKSSGADYITLFEQAWQKRNTAKVDLWRIFNSPEKQDMFPPKTSDADIIKTLRKEAEIAIDNTENIIRKRIDQFGIAQPNVQKQSFSGRILVELPGVDDRDRVRKQLKSTANLEFWDTYFSSQLYGGWQQVNDAISRKANPDAFAAVDSTAADSTSVAAADTTAANTAVVDTTSVAENALDTTASDIDTSSVDTSTTADDTDVKKELTPEEKRKNVLFLKFGPILDRFTGGEGCRVGFAKTSDTSDVNRMLNMPEAKALFPPDLRLLWSAKSEGNVSTLYAIKDASMKGKPTLDGSVIVNAYKDYNEVGDIVVSMSMNSDVGAPAWRKMTEKAAADNHRPIAIVMDNIVYSAPSVTNTIPDGRSQISFGSGQTLEKQIEEADDLAGLLKAGSLPAPAKIIDEVSIGPSIGEENIQAGLLSFIIAFFVILLYMFFYYAWAGWAANVALVANLFFMIGALISMHGALTLPGIAGIVLSMGMAVDANVIIYERVKEELRMGKAVSTALKDGFLKATSAIIDGNLTTLIAGIVLFIVGTGPIRGFATTLIIGIFTTLFTAIVVARLILYRRLAKKKPITFYSNITKNWFTNMNYDFVSKRKIFYAISSIIIVGGIVSMFTRGFNMGVDFVGGTSFRVEFAQQVDDNAVRIALNETMIENGQATSNTLQSVDAGGKKFKLTTNYMVDSESQTVEADIQTKVEEALGKVGTAFTIPSVSKVDPSMSDDFRTEAIWATIVALILIFVYILIRFRMWDYSVGAIVALLHDALMVLCAYTLLNGIVPFSLEVNQAFVGAILTVIGYSINDTVVIFDRIREYMHSRKNQEVKSIINDALNSTMGRSINTSMTVLLTLLVMFIFGSDDIRGFCFAMIVGVISGAYSTIFIASPIVVDIRNFMNRNNKAAAVETNVVAATV